MRTVIHRFRQRTHAAETASSDEDPVVALRSRVERARAMLPLQVDPALLQEMPADEIERELRLHVWIREQARRRRKRLAKRALAAEYRDHMRAARDRRWHAQALAAQRRATSSDARIAMLHRKTVRMSRSMYSAMAIGLVWSAVNVGINLGHAFGPDGPHVALWVLSFGLEGMISIPILHIMDQATTAARLGLRVDRTKIIAFEVPLLLTTLGLNAGPHLGTGDWGDAALFGVAPIMVVVGMWLHSWLADRYAQMIDAVSPAPATAEASEWIHDPAVDRSTTGGAATTGDGADRAGSARAMEEGWSHPSPPVTHLPAWTSGPVPAMSSALTLGAFRSAFMTSVDELSERTGPASAPTALSAESEDQLRDQCECIAHTMIERKESKLSEDHLVSVLRYAQAGWNPHAIAIAMSNVTTPPIHRGTINRIVLRATAMGLTITNAPLEVTPTERTA
jgi:hypothetical protein